MSNKCLIIMPKEEPSGYSQGHFARVYDYVIVPACRLAGYWPQRVDEINPVHPMDSVKEIVDAEVVVCDLSANNSNSHYGLAIRSALGLPFTVVKDLKSIVAFDTSDLGVLEYDESLRIDTVQKATEDLGSALRKAVENKKERYELLKRLHIPEEEMNVQPDVNLNSVLAEEETTHHVEAKPKEPRLPIISPLPDYVGEPFTEEQISQIKAGDVFFHLNHGKGKVNFVKKDGLASIHFESGTKLLVLGASDFFRKIKG